MIKKFFHAVMACGVIALVMSCEDQKFNNINVDVDKVELDHLTPDMIKVRDYVPEYAVVAHRGSTFWTPEETEAAYRWAREIGADYLECDMQVSKDGVVLALHDDNLKRTTNIENVFGETIPYEIRKAYYQKIGYSAEEADALVKEDAKNFVPNLPAYYTYEELMMLDAGRFNETSIEQARPSFASQHQYISTLEDLWRIPGGKCWNGRTRKTSVHDGTAGEKIRV
ncbi:MAG: glycerophosphodiester phosphodiesterase family protein [Butyricimonas faecihominis]